MKIVLYGAESTGKTTLSKALAQHFKTSWVPEFSRKYLQDKYDKTGEVCTYEDLMPIAKGQLQLEGKRSEEAQNNLLFCDTNILQTYYYGKAYYEDFQHQSLWNLVKTQQYDFYFLTYIDTPWEVDDLRDKPNERQEMHQLFKQSLVENDLPFMLLKGNETERLKKAIGKVNQLCKNVF